MQFLEEIIAKNKQQAKDSSSLVRDGFVLRCTYCQPTIGFENLPELKEHMMSAHNTDLIFMEQSREIQEKTVKFHRDFYNSVGSHKDEICYRLCKCTKLQNKMTRADLYVHSLEANHYPMVSCSICGVLMEREDAEEHAQAACNPNAEGSIFLEVQSKK